MSRNLIILLIGLIALIAAGCSSKGKESLDPPQEVTNIKEEFENAELGNEQEEEKTTLTELYLIDKNGLVVSQTLPLPQTEGTAKQALEYLVEDGLVTDLLPSGFKAVLPAGTTVDVDIQGDKAIADFSSEFAQYAKEDEAKILQSITWTLTQFDSIETVEIRMNGYELTEMPVNGLPINENGVTRKDGINTGVSASSDITNTRPLTVYYLSQDGENYYYVPITKRVSNQIKDDVMAAVQELIDGPSVHSGMMSAFELTENLQLISEPEKDGEGKVTLNFNESIYAGNHQNVIANEVLQSLVLTVTEQADIDTVAIMVNGEATLMNEEGEALTAPVSRPEKINKVSF